MAEVVFLSREVVLAIHEEQLAQHGGGIGVRDEGLLEPALGRPVNRAIYDATADLAAIAADYAFGVAENHPFIDGSVGLASGTRLSGARARRGRASDFLHGAYSDAAS